MVLFDATALDGVNPGLAPGPKIRLLLSLDSGKGAGVRKRGTEVAQSLRGRDRDMESSWEIQALAR